MTQLSHIAIQPAASERDEEATPVSSLSTDQATASVDPIEELALAWDARGRPEPQAAGSAWRCSVQGCHAMPFVRLDTAVGRRSLCLCHFDSITRRLRFSDRARAAGSSDSAAGGRPM